VASKRSESYAGSDVPPLHQSKYGTKHHRGWYGKCDQSGSMERSAITLRKLSTFTVQDTQP
jgi:hypothetical protein